MFREFDSKTARRGLRLYQRAHERLNALHAEHVSTPMPWEAMQDAFLDVMEVAITALTWARFMDDWCMGKDGRQALPGYEEARPQVAGFLEAARYVTNYVLHQANPMMTPYGIGRMSDRKPYPDYLFGGLTWMQIRDLHPEADERDNRQRQFRKQYDQVLAGKDIRNVLGILRGWFEQQLGQEAKD